MLCSPTSRTKGLPGFFGEPSKSYALWLFLHRLFLVLLILENLLFVSGDGKATLQVMLHARYMNPLSHKEWTLMALTLVASERLFRPATE